MAVMIPNARLRESLEKPEQLTPAEVKALVAEVLRSRKFIRGKIELFKLRNE